ncbi:MAG TPA: methylated-DNA--[protein]-cysteine S-methyltransferase [Gaiellaceae bacterium]|nr:methylated-DNA--[protein]-cysteine S-methyltransferase [Gaiellaceae bacterium]
MARVTHLSYEVPRWGAGDAWLADGRLVESTHPRRGPARGDTDAHPLAIRLRDWFAGSRDDFLDVELELEWCTPLQRALVDALRRVPYGEVVTYGELAALAGRPGAPRAAGAICATNRFAVVVPCHRVVAAGGIGGYGSLGAEYKRRLLRLEGVAV